MAGHLFDRVFEARLPVLLARKIGAAHDDVVEAHAPVHEADQAAHFAENAWGTGVSAPEQASLALTASAPIFSGLPSRGRQESHH